MTDKELCKIAINNMNNAYAPYSGFTVGAALLTKNGKVFGGANIENSSYSATVCAERVAFSGAVFSGEKEFEMLAISGGKNKTLKGAVPPCGVCLQTISEFCDKDFKILLVEDNESFKTVTLKELLPFGFILEK